MRHDLFGFGGNVRSESYVTDQGIPAHSGRGVVNYEPNASVLTLQRLVR